MIQNFNFSQRFEKLSIEEPDYQDGKLCLSLTLDSKNKVYNFSYSHSGELASYFDYIGQFILDKPLDDFQHDIAFTIFSISEHQGVVWDTWLANQALMHFKKLLNTITGRQFYSALESDKLICRCFAKDIKAILTGYEEYKGSKVDFLKNSFLSSGCGQCRSLFDQLWADYDQASEYFQGKSPSEIIDIVKAHMAEFKDYSAQDLSSLELRNIGFEAGIFTFEFSEKIEINFEALENSLVNYLSPRLGFVIKLRFTFLA